MNAKILIVEDQFVEANNLQRILEKAGYKICPIARSVAVALRIIEKERPDMVLIDIYLQGDLTGIDLARDLMDTNTAFVYISANSSKETLDAAKSTRPYGFLVKPFREKDVLVMLDVAWYLHQQKLEGREKHTAAARSSKTGPHEVRSIVGVSQAILDTFEHIQIVSPSNTSVLLLGESGTGKELVAKAIHQNSTRKDKAMVVVNCAALPVDLAESELFGHERGAFTNATSRKPGKFELANGSTIFLDEIGEMSLELQVKFLRVLQEQEIEPIGGTVRKLDIRIIAATNRNLEEEVANGHFRIDLYYRLNVFPITLPPLRERKADILPLANHFLKIYAGKENKNITGFSSGVIDMMQEYNWPGNVRELENMMERSVLLCNGPVIEEFTLPKARPVIDIDKDSPVKTMRENERDHVISVLRKCNWRLSGPGGAAELLEINEFTLRSRMKKLGIQKEKVRKNGRND